MKRKYRISDGAVLAVGYMPDLSAGPGEAVEDHEGEIPKNLNDFRRIGPGGLLEKTPAEKQADHVAFKKKKKDDVLELAGLLNVSPGKIKRTLELLKAALPEDAD